jgi:hypothetical protein
MTSEKCLVKKQAIPSNGKNKQNMMYTYFSLKKSPFAGEAWLLADLREQP